MNVKKQFLDGMFFQNPVTVQLLGMCSVLAITTTLFNGIGMGLSVLVILTCANVVISLLRKIIPNKIRIACYIVVIAGFVTIVDLVLKAFLPDLSESLGLFIPLIVVNCIILGRAEQYASKNGSILSIFDGVGIGLGFTIALTLIGMVRELIGSGTLFGFQIMPEKYEPVSIFVLAPGAFFVLSILCALQNKFKAKGANRHVKGNGVCSGNCAECPSAEAEGKTAKGEVKE